MFFRLLIWITLILICFPALADTAIGYRLFAKSSQANSTSIFNVTDENDSFSHSQLNELYAKLQVKGFNLLATYNVTFNEDRETEDDGVLNEAYYDFSASSLDFTIGKKVLSWGVGYGFRPLDLIQQENRRVLISQNLEGVLLTSAEYYTGNSAISFLITNRELISDRQSRSKDHEAAVKLYSLYNDWDLHGVGHYSEVFGASFGLGFSTIVGDELEVHASSTYRSRYHKLINVLTESNETFALTDPVYEKHYNDCINAVLGFSWTFQSGITVIGEAWHDCTAYTYSEWAAMRDLTKQQQLLLSSLPQAAQDATETQIQGNQRYFNQANILQNNLFTRLSYDGEKTDPYLDVLLTPDDGGVVLSTSIEHEIKQNILLYANARYFTGRSSSAYKQLGNRALIYLGFRAEFVL